MLSDDDVGMFIRDIETFRSAQKVLGAKPSNESQEIVWKSMKFNIEAQDIGYFHNYTFEGYNPHFKFPYLVALGLGRGPRIPNWSIHLYAVFFKIWKASKGVIIAEQDTTILFVATRKRFIFTINAVQRELDGIKDVGMHRNNAYPFVDVMKLNNIFANVDIFPQEISFIALRDMTGEAMERLINE